MCFEIYSFRNRTHNRKNPCGSVSVADKQTDMLSDIQTIYQPLPKYSAFHYENGIGISCSLVLMGYKKHRRVKLLHCKQ